jgi:hypothetical protein
VLDGIDAAALTLRATSRAQQLLGASDGWVARLAETQYTLGEGPGVDAAGTGEPVLVAEVGAHQARWPGFAQAAAAAGVGAVFAFPLQVGAIRLGTLELLRRRPGALNARETTDAALLARLATSALLDDAQRAEDAGQEWRPRSVASYQDVHVVTGMIAWTLRISVEDAFARLRADAFARDRSVLELARDVLDRRINIDELAD